MKKTIIAKGIYDATKELLERELRLGHQDGLWDYEFLPIYDNIDKERFIIDMVDMLNYKFGGKSILNDRPLYEYDYINQILYLTEKEQ